ncbi:hypothetical protein B566_EDAN006158 [Ephemera danica]|nr:hypothetical protein B566_EDAN006158 [Ephemera danica]
MTIPALELTFSFLCGFAAMPGGPFGRQFGDNGWFQLVPVNRGRGPCPDIIKRHDVTFHLYHAHDSRRYHTLAVRDEALLKRSGFDPRLPTVLYIHGFLSGPDAKDVITNVVSVGEYVGQFLDYLSRHAGPLHGELHLIGHGLGAHVAGVAANSTTRARVSRITGLDPSLQRIGNFPINRRLDPGDAQFIDVIHTDGGIFGVTGRFGHADFYVNRGKAPQPGCNVNEVAHTSPAILGKVFCSHWRAYELYAATVLNDFAYPAMRCLSLREFEQGQCRDPSEVVPMGYAVPNSARGTYYLMHKKRPAIIARNGHSRRRFIRRNNKGS